MGIGMVLIVNEVVVECIFFEVNFDVKVYCLGYIIEGEGVVFK